MEAGNMLRTKSTKFAQCPCTGRNLDKFMHAAILTLLAQEPLHGYELINRLARLRMFQGRKPDPTGVYRLIRQMEEEGLVRSTLEPSATGPAKHSNRLTAAGKQCLAQWGETLAAFQEGISELLAAIKKV
jgi:DNA-binding PadR family transcriptional regulator